VISKEIEVHYRKKDGSISCGSIYSYNTTDIEEVTCPICKGNQAEKGIELDSTSGDLTRTPWRNNNENNI